LIADDHGAEQENIERDPMHPSKNAGYDKSEFCLEGALVGNLRRPWQMFGVFDIFDQLMTKDIFELSKINDHHCSRKI